MRYPNQAGLHCGELVEALHDGTDPRALLPDGLMATLLQRSTGGSSSADNADNATKLGSHQA
jgi:hypothetical protein